MSVLSAVLGVLAVLVLTAGTGYFVAQEFAYVSADRLALAREAEAGDRRAARALKVLGRLSFMLSGAQLGITVTGLIVGFIAEPSVSALLEPALTGVGVPEGAVGGISVVVAFVAATVVQMVFGELAPKNLALAVPERLAKSLAASTLAYLKVVGPVVHIFDGAANKLLRKVGVEPVEELHHGATLEELGHLIGESHEQGELPTDTAELLDHALEFSERTLDEVMVPRAGAVFVHKDASAAEAVELIARHGHSNYPVLGDHPDDVAGVLGVRELMRLPAQPLTATTAGALARRPLLLPDTLPLPDAVTRMRERDDEFAVVLDEHGGVAGIVTYEDIAEELVGDIADESDTVVELAVPDGTGWLVDAGRRLDEVADATGVALPEEEDYDTVAGLVVDRLGRFPAIGDRLTVDLPDGGSAVIDVRTLDRHVPDTVRLERLPAREREEEQA
ncbi:MULTISPECIES: hemolysin family protein [Streptomyces]|uniref:Hemolysin family protein n=1 Tax=Streptomyces caniscabiei TaxID=2746961 RepID=A0ABU4MV28_9ACTN|nr:MULTISPECIES: hemolysin family protein [Streptomyces]MBE4741048.1 HlyC/CorC family transporter [Streptomyces caniscabiei]MBE4760397.1 HlyC/CorC family transporter [Streptomyces caniscabiei]MBE4774437.1 HlyC/CorC family transporter [Streptomyces caniscabiei]MBE4789340.1 HlyC/CorC family transporter [Streptomyces caniscabiei]MBE4798439.1 HlyC/CorC family transporter [Streptomyces caniscabiei]